MLTDFVNRQIVEALDPTPDCEVIDIGCGDGSLLASMQARIRHGLGILPSAPELARLQQAHRFANIDFAQGLADAVPAADRSQDRVIINGVLLLLDAAAVHRSLAELKRIARPGALVYIGEIPVQDELQSKNRYRGNSTLGFLMHKWRYKGTRKALRKAWSLLRARIGSGGDAGGEARVVFGGRQFAMPPEAFLELCRNVGLAAVWARPHREVRADGTERVSATRMDYLLRA
jgi:SAM-dependent methyltransferase